MQSREAAILNVENFSNLLIPFFCPTSALLRCASIRRLCELQSDVSLILWFFLQLSSSSMDVGIVPDSSMSDISTSYVESLSQGSFDFPRTVPMNQVETPMAREARVMRYKEKRKNRKFEKTIRYASRKAYAESRPRIKGRFAKRNSSDMNGLPEVYPVVTDSAAFGVVPSF